MGGLHKSTTDLRRYIIKDAVWGVAKFVLVSESGTDCTAVTALRANPSAYAQATPYLHLQLPLQLVYLEVARMALERKSTGIWHCYLTCMALMLK